MLSRSEVRTHANSDAMTGFRKKYIETVEAGSFLSASKKRI
jgi:hypothetical protein